VSRAKLSTHFEITVLAGRDEALLQAEPPSGEVERLAAAAAVALQVLEALADLNLTRVKRLDVELESGLRVLASPMDGHVLVAFSESAPGPAHLSFRLLAEEVSSIVTEKTEANKKL